VSLFRVLVLGLSCWSWGCAFGSGSVVRVYHGREEPGRYVSHHAYAAFAQGALLEARGDLRGAQSAYDRALAQDTQSAEIWTRLGSLRCQLGQPDAGFAFDRAIEIDLRYEPAWRERARCELRTGKLDDALEAAETAFQLDPNNELTTLLLAELYERLGRTEEAMRWLEAWVTRDPASTAGYTALEAMAARHRDSLRQSRAARGLALLAAHRGTLDRDPKAAARERLDRALILGDIAEARHQATVARVTPPALALRAAALGSFAIARAQAEWVLAADTRSADAWIAWSVSMEPDVRERPPGTTGFARLEAGAPSPFGVRVLADFLLRRTGAPAAKAWIDSQPPLPPPSDPLERELEARLSEIR
jgi:tetratricopeptide (TPR) repeat protein